MIDFERTFKWKVGVMRHRDPTSSARPFIVIQFDQDGGSLIVPMGPEMAREVAQGLVEAADQSEATIH